MMQGMLALCVHRNVQRNTPFLKYCLLYELRKNPQSLATVTHDTVLH